MTATGIEWTDRVWNPVTGCTKVSSGCKHCYAEVMAKRTFGTLYPDVEIETCGPQGTITRPRQFTDVQTHDQRLTAPLSWRKPCRVFVNSMSDLFHEDVPDAFIDRVFAVMALTPRHTYQILTKRPSRMRQWAIEPARLDRLDAALLQLVGDTNVSGQCFRQQPSNPDNWPLPNVWLGVSAENQETADARIQLLLETPAAVRFVSAEPLLGRIDLDRLYSEYRFERGGLEQRWDSAIRGKNFNVWVDGDIECPRLDWVIVGGESGPQARPCAEEWIESIVRQCRAASVPVFVKQFGAYSVSEARAADTPEQMRELLGPDARWPEHRWLWRAGLVDRKGADLAEWPEHLRVREFPGVRA